MYDEGWDLFGYAGWDPRLQAMVVSFRGTDSHSIYNWAENMRYWRTDFKVPFPGSDGSKVHTGTLASLSCIFTDCAISSEVQCRPCRVSEVRELSQGLPEVAFDHVRVLDLKSLFLSRQLCTSYTQAHQLCMIQGPALCFIHAQ